MFKYFFNSNSFQHENILVDTMEHNLVTNPYQVGKKSENSKGIQKMVQTHFLSFGSTL